MAIAASQPEVEIAIERSIDRGRNAADKGAVELCAPGWEDYELIDSGHELRLERIGPVVISRQSAQAIWPPALPESEWKALLHASHYRPDQGAGDWTMHRSVPDAWEIGLGRLRLEVRLTQFGHIGFFPENQVQWPWIEERCRERPGAEVLNLFAYTGGASLAAACGGARVTHVDAAKGVVTWGRENAARSGLGEAPVRWIVDDVLKFMYREQRRGRRFDAIVLDPPTFGRGPQGSVWKIERDLTELLALCAAMLTDEPLFLLLTAHTPGVTAAVLRNLLKPIEERFGGTLVAGDMVQSSHRSPCLLPAGVYCRWVR